MSIECPFKFISFLLKQKFNFYLLQVTPAATTLTLAPATQSQPLSSSSLESPETALLLAEEFGTRMKRERLRGVPSGPLALTEVPTPAAKPPSTTEPLPHQPSEHVKAPGFRDAKPLARAALHSAPESVVPLYRSQEEEVAVVEFGTRIPELGPQSADLPPRDFPIRKNHGCPPSYT